MGQYSVFSKKVNNYTWIHWKKYKDVSGSCATGEYCVFDFVSKFDSKINVVVYEAVVAFIKWYNETEYFHEDKIKSMLKNGEVKEVIEYAEKNNIDAVTLKKLCKGIDIDLPF